MITNGEKWYYLALIRGVTSKNNSDKYGINCLHLFWTDYKLKLLENMCKNHLRNLIKYEYNQDRKSIKIIFVIHADTESFLEKIQACGNNPEKSFTTKVNKHAVCGYSIFIQCSFNATK